MTSFKTMLKLAVIAVIALTLSAGAVFAADQEKKITV